MNHTSSIRVHTRVQDICLMISQDQLIRIQVQKLQKVWSWAQNWIWSWVLHHCWELKLLKALFHCMVRHGTVQYGSLLGGFPLGTVPGTWYFFSTTSAGVPSDPYCYQNVTCKLCWSLIGRRESSSLNLWHETQHRPARFKSLIAEEQIQRELNEKALCIYFLHFVYF